MTTNPTEAHCATPAPQPLALKSNDVLGPNAQVVAWAYRRAGATYIQLTDPGPIPNQDVAPVEWCRPLVFGDDVALCAAELHTEIGRLLDENFALSAGQCAEIARLRTLVRRATSQLRKWSAWYGNADHAARGQLPLPPAGDVELAEDISAALGPNVADKRQAPVLR